MKTEKMHSILIDQVSQKFDGQNNLVEENRKELVGARFGGSDNFMAAYKAMRELDPDDKLNLNTLEVKVDGSCFQG